MRIAVCLLAMMLAVPLVPVSVAQAPPPEDPDPTHGGAVPSPEDLELRRRLHELFGLQPIEPIPASGFCKPGAGCFPIYVDEAGDTMTGVLRMLDDVILVNSQLDLIDGGAQGQVDPLALPDSYIRYDRAELNMPMDFTNELTLLQGALLNATAGGTVFIDYDGNLSFADGSWFRPGDGHWFSNMTFESSVVIRGEGNHLFVTEGATIVTDNQSGFLTQNGIGRIGTLDFHPLHLIVNNTTAFRLIPGSTASLVGGHKGNDVANGTVGVIIAGGGAAGGIHNATANFTAILGGLNNTAHGAYAVVLGGRNNDAWGIGSLAAGQRAGALHNGTFVWADGQGTDFASTGNDQFLVRAQGGVGINTDAPQSALTVAGDITPAANDTYALGSPSHRWNQLYMASEIDYASDLLYNSGGAERARLTTTGDFVIGGSFIGDGSGLTGVVATGLAEASVTTATIQDDAVTGTKLAGGSVNGDHLAPGAVGPAALQGAAVTTDKIQDAAITSGKLADGAVTTAKIGATCAEAQLLKHINGTWVCADDQGSSTLQWSAITEKPAGFADEVDDDTTYTAGSGIVLDGTTFQLPGCPTDDILRTTSTGVWECDMDRNDQYTAGSGLAASGNTFSVDTAAIQSRVAGACGPGSSIRAISDNGTVTCELDDDTDTTYSAGDGIVLSGTMFSLLGCQSGEMLKINSNGTWACAADADSGGDVTGVTAGTGLTGGGTSGDVELAVDTTTIQSRVTGTCAEDETMGGINANGTVVCRTDDDTTYTNGAGLVLDGTTFAVNETQVQTRITATCAPGFSIRAIAQDGSVTCEEDTDTDTDTTYGAGSGLALIGTTFSADTGVVQSRVASTCAAGSSIRAIAQNGTVTCEEDTDTDTDTTYGAGSGLALIGTTFSADTGVVQSRVASTCAAGSSIRAIAQNGTVTCEDDTDTDTTYAAAGPLSLTGTTFGLAPCAAGEILRYDGVWFCSEDEVATSIAWSSVTGKPAGFADDVDDDTTYTNGTGLALNGTTFAVDPTQVQSRVTGNCGMIESASGHYMTTIFSDGSVACAADDDTQYTAGSGLALTGTTFSADTGVVQSRVASTCAAGSSIRAIAENGTVTCEDDTDTDTTYSAGFGLDLSGTTFIADTAEVQQRVASSCAAGNAIRVISPTGSVTCESTTAAETLDGLDSSQFLRGDASDTFTGGEFTIASGSDLNVAGTLKSHLIPATNDTYMLGNSTHRYSDLWLASAIHYASPLTFESGGQTRMTLQPDGDLDVAGELNSPGGVRLTESGNGLMHFGSTGKTGQANGWDPNPSTFEQGTFIEGGAGESAGIYMDGDVLSMWSPGDLDLLRVYDEDLLPSGGPAFAVDPDGDIRVGDSDGLTDDTVFFDQSAEFLRWVEGAGEFRMSDDLRADGVVRAGGAPSATTYHSFGGAAPASGDISSAGDLMVGFDLEVASDLYLSRNLFMEGQTSGTDGDQNIWFFNGGNKFGESLKWVEADDRFAFSDQVSMESLVLAAKLLEVFGEDLRFDGDTVCTSAGNCGGSIMRLVAPNDLRLGSISEDASGSGGRIAGAAGPDVTPTLTSLGPVSVCFWDSSLNGAYESGEPLYLNVDSDACGNSVAQGDIRLVATAGQAAFTVVRTFHTDFGRALTDGNAAADAGLEDGAAELDYYDADGNGHLNGSDCVYSDIDAGGTVTVGDLRWTPCGVYAAGSIVSGANTDAGNGLSGGGAGSFALDTAASYWDAEPNGGYDYNDVVYVDVSEG